MPKRTEDRGDNEMSAINKRDLIESIAMEIYKRIPFDGPTGQSQTKPPWQLGGNSIRQDDARAYARIAIDTLAEQMTGEK
jgi:hypothetical protein